MRITVERKVGQAITVSIDDENLVNHIGIVEEKPIEQETCKWKKFGGDLVSPHKEEGILAVLLSKNLPMNEYCSHCGKKIKVIE